jgi:hypothetical protein
MQIFFYFLGESVTVKHLMFTWSVKLLEKWPLSNQGEILEIWRDLVKGKHIPVTGHGGS